MSESSDPMYVEVAKLKLALADLWRDIGDDFKWWNPLQMYCHQKAARLYVEAITTINEWETFKAQTHR